MSLRIAATGIRAGEVIEASQTAKQNKGTVIKILGFYPPTKSWVDNLSDVDFRDSLNNYPFFSSMTVNERKAWLDSNSVARKESYLEDFPSLRVKFLEIGGKYFMDKRRVTVSRTLLQGNPSSTDGSWTIKEVYDMFTPAKKTRARRHTLVFRPQNWRVRTRDPSRVCNYNGIYIDIDTGVLGNGVVTCASGRVLRKREVTVAKLVREFAIYASVGSYTLDTLLDLADTVCKIDRSLVDMLKWAPPSVHKSLIQKLIRTRCNTVTHMGKSYTACCVLLVSFSMLLSHQGAFVPDIQRFVSGIESATKRLAVTIVEDGYTEIPGLLVSLFGASLMAQMSREWKPSLNVIKVWMTHAVKSQQSQSMYQYDWHNFSEVNITQLTPHTMSYILLAEIRSFKSDIDMMGSIAQFNGVPRETTGKRMEPMPLIHCLDHHSFTQIVHLMTKLSPSSNPSKPYKETLSNIWYKVVGINPRKGHMIDMNNPYVIDIRRAQESLWKLKTTTKSMRGISLNAKKEAPLIIPETVIRDYREGSTATPYPSKGPTVTVSYRLDTSTIAGLIGPMEFRIGRVTAIVVIRVENVYEFTAVKKPSREDKSIPELTDSEKSTAIRMARNALYNGVKLVNVPSTLPMLKDLIVVLRDDQFYLSNGTEMKYLENVLNIGMSFPLHPKMDPTLENAISYTGNGIDESADLNSLVASYTVEELKRISLYLRGYKSSIALNKVSRNGGGVDYSVSLLDTRVYHFLAALCVLYPAAIELTKDVFKVKNGPLLWSIRDKVLSSISTDRTGTIRIQPDSRVLWEHQRDSVGRMLKKRLTGKRGHLIWIPVGMGKTLIFMRYLHELAKRNMVPKYVVYTLPPSAVDSIQRELNTHQIPHKLIDMRMSSSKDKKLLSQGVVNLLWHDHMRLNGMPEQLRIVAPDCLFIIDEFHKTLSKTIRTSIALETLKLSADFIGMSGTIIKDENVEDLIAWLEQVVEFEVTAKNYWVAVGALISRKVHTKVVVERAINEVPLLHSEEYYKSVPASIGGTAEQIDMKAALYYSYEAITKHIVNLVATYLSAGEGMFIVARDKAHSQELINLLTPLGARIHLITRDHPITLASGDTSPINVVITTKNLAEGYTLTKFRVMITGVYFSNQAVREQLEGRINRIGQTFPKVRIHVVHSGILSYIFKRYETARTLSEALKGFAKEVGTDASSIRNM